MELNKYQRIEVLATPAAYRIMMDTVRINREMYDYFSGESMNVFAGRLAGAALTHYQDAGYLLFVAGPLVVKLTGRSAAVDGTTTFNEVRIRMQYEAGQDLEKQDYCFVATLTGDWEEWA